MKEVIHKLPQEFLHKLKKIYPANYSNIAATFLAKRQTTFRINYLKTDLISLRKSLMHQRVKFKELSYPKGSFLLKTTLREFQKTSLYQEGVVYVQNLSSMLPVTLSQP